MRLGGSFVVVIVLMLVITTTMSAQITPLQEEVQTKLENKEMSMNDIFNIYGNTNGVKLVTNKYRDSYDYDNDGLSDYYEVFRYFTDPNNPDSDGDGIIDGDWEERKEYTYTITAQMRLLPPYDIEYMKSHPYQDIRVVEEKAKSLFDSREYLDFEIILYPFNKEFETLVGNPNWQEDNKDIMSEVEPGNFNDWDDQFKEDLLSFLHAHGVYPEELDDLELVFRIQLVLSELLVDIYLDEVDDGIGIHMYDWYVEFKDGEPSFIAKGDLRQGLIALNQNTDRMWTEEYFINTISSGKELFYERVNGTCSSVALFYANVLQALGIPTKVAPIATLVDTNYFSGTTDMLDERNLYQTRANQKFQNELVQESWNSGLDEGRTTHVSNIIYIGNKWVPVNFTGWTIGYPQLSGDHILFFRWAEYDFANANIIEVKNDWLSYEERQRYNRNKNFPYDGHTAFTGLWKPFAIEDGYGEHTSYSTRQYISRWGEKEHSILSPYHHLIGQLSNQIGNDKLNWDEMSDREEYNKFQSSNVDSPVLLYNVELTGDTVYVFDGGRNDIAFRNKMELVRFTNSRGFVYEHLVNRYPELKDQADAFVISANVPYRFLPSEIKAKIEYDDYKSIGDTYYLEIDKLRVLIVGAQ